MRIDSYAVKAAILFAVIILPIVIFYWSKNPEGMNLVSALLQGGAVVGIILLLGIRFTKKKK